jgi:A49-like RNA polymerase I associated factor
MSSEKRKAPHEWVDASIMEEDGLRGVYLANFSGVVPPETITFREYKRKRGDIPAAKDVILQGETERIEFEGRTRGDDLADNCQYTHLLRGLI